MYNNDAQRCLTGEVRLSYVNLDKPRQPQGGVGDAKYSATLLIPKTDTATIADFRAAIQAAAQIGARIPVMTGTPAPAPGRPAGSPRRRSRRRRGRT